MLQACRTGAKEAKKRAGKEAENHDDLYGENRDISAFSVLSNARNLRSFWPLIGWSLGRSAEPELVSKTSDFDDSASDPDIVRFVLWGEGSICMVKCRLSQALDDAYKLPISLMRE